ncbi:MULTISPECIES: hypothetical protein [Streptomyces]|jgi:hypothetical protein|uniref:FXSXX-COOH protein n=1 Tax=Streptomyces sp. 900129855 TaxID=3155129 RepID=A0ABV2ZGH9_9ACTN
MKHLSKSLIVSTVQINLDAKRGRSMSPSIGSSVPQISGVQLSDLMEEAGPVLRAALERRYTEGTAEFKPTGFNSFIIDES